MLYEVITIKGSYFADSFSVDLVWTPLFESDRYIDGERFSYNFV